MFAYFAVALLLPWLAGWLCLAVIDAIRRAEGVSYCRQIGYGFFLGYSMLHGLVLAENFFLGGIVFVPVLLILAVFVMAAAAVSWRFSGRWPVSRGNQPEPRARRWETILLYMLLGWAVLHMVFTSIEILHQPVFPWDAWASWIYRAKTWFLAGSIVPIDDPGEWLRGTGSGLYNAPGNQYPTFPSIVALWAAVALGRWSETLINLPVLLCGAALGLGLYGQCREYGLQRWQSALAAYLLLSVPLIGSHLSLAGQADIWMVGFTGLGFVALLHGSIRSDRYQLCLGIGMVALAMTVKSEGAVWFLAALVTLALARYPLAAKAGLALALAIGLSVWVTGISSVQLPLLGRLGFADGRVYIPLLGSYALQSFDLGTDYWVNFFGSGTWHLLWTGVALCTLSLWLLPAGILRRTIAAFYGMLLLSQLFIFEGTEAGRWADDWTAINRLPMPFTAPLIFTLIIALREFIRQENAVDKRRALFAAPLLGIALSMAGALGYLYWTFPATDAEKFELGSRDMRIVGGDGSLSSVLDKKVDSYSNGVAILTSGPVMLDAARFPLLRVKTGGPNGNGATFFWRNGSAPEDMHSAKIPVRGVYWLDLDRFSDWRGQISEIGLVFYDDRGKFVEFDSLQLQPGSLIVRCRKLIYDWLQTSRWSLRSLNWVPAGSGTSTIPLPVFVAAWLLVTILVAVVLFRHTPGIRTGMAICGLVAWFALDLRWTANRWLQATETMATYPLVTATQLEFGDDASIRRLVEVARPYIEGSEVRTMFIAEADNMQFQLLRAKYHALPARVFIYGKGLSKLPPVIPDFILLLKQRFSSPGHQSITPAAYLENLRRRKDLYFSPVLDTPDGFLVRVSREPVLPGTAQ